MIQQYLLVKVMVQQKILNTCQLVRYSLKVGSSSFLHEIEQIDEQTRAEIYVGVLYSQH